METPNIPKTSSPYQSKTSSDGTDTPTSSRGVITRKRKKGSPSKPTICFACKDSGESLIECTRKNCTKAYHMACTGRTAAFFKQKKVSWQCSSHLCAKCDKAAIHCCYTCTYSLCKGCKKEPGFWHVTGSSGLCKSCTEKVRMIEKNEQGNEELTLFRNYWSMFRRKAVKRNVSSGLTEIINRLNGQNGGKLDHTNDSQVSKAGSSSEHLEVCSSKRRKLSRCSELSVLEGSSSEASMDHEEGVSMTCEEDWASKELLDFVRYMRKGDTSALSHFGVKALLLEYIKQNNLRDPHQQTQIVCDSRLKNLFGKARIQHFEMFQYLRMHLLKKDRQGYFIEARSSDAGPSPIGITGIISPHNDDCAAITVHLETKDNCKLPERSGADQGVKIHKLSEDKSPHTILDYAAIDTQLETGDNSKPLEKADGDKGVRFCKMGEHKSQQTSLDCVSTDTKLTDGDFSKVPRKVGAYEKPNMRKKGEQRSPENNLNEYASIDPHNVNFLYLRCNLLVDLLEDINKLHDRIVGSFVRITIEATEKQGTHRLVEVIGTGKAPQPYEIGAKTTNVLLEVMNLSKTEMVPMVKLSNDDFSEEECKYLRENMKSGLIKQMTVREVQEKAMVLQKVRAHSLEKEKQSLCSRRDFLSEKGKRKQLGECVKKLQLLEERLRKVLEVPDIHADPNPSPNDKSQDASSDDEVQDNYTGHTEFVSNSEERNPTSSGIRFSVSNGSFRGEKKILPTAQKSGKNAVVKCVQDNGDIANGSSERTDGTSWDRDREGGELVVVSALDTGTGNSQIVVESGSSNESMTASFISETHKLWHYHDPSGRIQGPFSMLQLCKWSTTSSFPANMRIWKKAEMQEDSILLTDALNNTFSPLKFTAASEGKSGNNVTNLHYAVTVSQICQPTLTSSAILLKPMDELNASGALCTPGSYMPQSQSMVIQLTCDPPVDHDNITSSNDLPFARHLFQGTDINISSSQPSTPHLSDQMLIQSALNLPRDNASSAFSNDLPLPADVGTAAAGDSFQISKNDLSSSQQASSPKVAGDCTVASLSVSQGMTSQSTSTNDLTDLQADCSEKEIKSGACLAARSKVNGETRHQDILTTDSQSVIHGTLSDVDDSVNPPAELAGVNLVNPCENRRCNSSYQESERDLRRGSESLGWESALVQNQETLGPGTDTMATGWVTAAEVNQASDQDTWQIKNANEGWDEQIKDMISSQSHSNDRNFSGAWGEPAGNTPTWKNPHNEYRVSGHQNLIQQGNDFGDRSSSSSWNRHSDFVAGIQGPSSGKRLCKFHQNGYCWNGGSCGFSHDKEAGKW